MPDIESVGDGESAGDLSSSGGCSTPVRIDGRPEPCDDGPALEPGLVDKPPIPPAGHAAAPRAEHFGGGSSEVKSCAAAVTFDDAVELKFQRWFPNSAPPQPPPVAATAAADRLSLNGLTSYQYSERVVGDSTSITYTRSSSSMSVRGGGGGGGPDRQQQLDEEHLYSNLSAVIGGVDKLKPSVSVDLLDALRTNDGVDNGRRRQQPSAHPKFKKRPKKTAVPPAVQRAKTDVQRQWEVK